MKIIKCANGHFFDSDNYLVCPQCGAPAAQTSNNQTVSDTISAKKRGFHFFSPKSKSRETKDVEVVEARSIEKAPDIIREDDIPKNNPILSHDSSKPKPDIDRTRSCVHPANGQIQLSDSEPDSQPTISLVDAVRQASASSEGKTLSYFNALSTASSKSPDDSYARVTDPVVGWLVCIGGINVGACYCIFSGMNSIGREKNNRIVISTDEAVSREKHALLIFEPRKQIFIVKPGDSSGLTYVNDNLITESIQLSNNDIIEIGRTRLMFIQLCGNGFSWQDYIK